MKKEMYHTQEKRAEDLRAPIVCKRENAWLGVAYYFWDDINDAHSWGANSKKGTGVYQIYRANIESDNILDTVFNEEHYRFWVKSIEKAALSIAKKIHRKPTLKEIKLYFKERASWDEVDGIQFQDVPINDELLVFKFYYRKRIQLAVYNLRIISNFALLNECECN